jgi:acylphosphatase
VRNLPDGRVEALAEGDLEAVERFGRHLARGPAGARVDRIDTAEEIPDGRVRTFEIRG